MPKILIKKTSIISRFDGSNFNRVENTKHEHRGSALGLYQGRPFVTGGFSNPTGKTEMYSANSLAWGSAADNPFGGLVCICKIINKRNRLRYFNSIYLSIYGFATASTDDAVFIFGGSLTQRSIAEYKNGNWKIVGELNKNRYGNVRYLRFRTYSISFGEHTIIIDSQDETVEIWNLEQKERITTFKRPNGMFHCGWGLFLIEKNFCT